MLSCPVPWSSVFESANGCAVYIKIILIMFGVSFGLLSDNNAAAPATIGVDIDVPLDALRLGAA